MKRISELFSVDLGLNNVVTIIMEAPKGQAEIEMHVCVVRRQVTHGHDH